MTKTHILLIVIFSTLILFFFPKNYKSDYYYTSGGQEYAVWGGCFDACIGIKISKKSYNCYQNTCFGIIYL